MRWHKPISDLKNLSIKLKRAEEEEELHVLHLLQVKQSNFRILLRFA